MEKPYRYRRKLVKVGNSYYVLAPTDWLKLQATKLKIKKIEEVVLEVYDDKLVIIPLK